MKHTERAVIGFKRLGAIAPLYSTRVCFIETYRGFIRDSRIFLELRILHETHSK